VELYVPLRKFDQCQKRRRQSILNKSVAAFCNTITNKRARKPREIIHLVLDKEERNAWELSLFP
jgi:hypothetical protein